ncbi:unnamed protein product [Adineta steineri]|uniref:Uncharacterized protein n=1 Tax=Adineta steineri TaxID=433720 RepID=A0A813WY38_9BILA|nr:unnamed protein product [Adineta steineri]CAF0838367.1 unnamed protein product [Adineta steineri]CAF0862256.1 unnamed protein product [Adineta steineri]CAF3727614.1 unnamed protein product [Adineta steineri]CAF3948106.1 unnamed protein product [Adineta steineri]
MIGIPLHTKSISIRLDGSGFFETGFDPTYPHDLYGIISPDEFQESMNRINHPFLSMKKEFCIICTISLFLVTLGICLIIAAQTTTNPNIEILLGIGILTANFGLWPSCFLCSIIPCVRDRKLLQAVEKESIKYSCRSPIPCAWRLENSTNTMARNGNDFCRLVIDIGRIMVTKGEMHDSNQVTSVPISLSQHQDNSMPPPYSAQIPRFCSQCNAPRQNLTTKFCSLCGHSLDKYPI